MEELVQKSTLRTTLFLLDKLTDRVLAIEEEMTKFREADVKFDKRINDNLIAIEELATELKKLENPQSSPLPSPEKPLKVTFPDRAEWRLKGKLHREDGPAIEFKSGTKKWFQDGMLHREDGPAVQWANGNFHYYLEGNFYPRFPDYAREVAKRHSEKQ